MKKFMSLVFVLCSVTICDGALLTGRIERLWGSQGRFYWGDGVHDLYQDWTVANKDSSGWFYGSARTMSNADVYVYSGLNDPTTITDASVFAYRSSSAKAQEGDSVFFRGTNGYYGAWHIENIYYDPTNPIDYAAMNGTWYFLDDGSANFAVPPEDDVPSNDHNDSTEELPGRGTYEAPYLIHTAEQMIYIGVDPNCWYKHFKLMADIDLSTHALHAALIAPDADNTTSVFEGPSFAGVFDGNGHKVTGLTISGAGAVGLFGWNSGEIRDLGLEGGSVRGTMDNIGAMVGINDGRVTGCYSFQTVRGDDVVGGLVGRNDDSGIVQDCYCTGYARGNLYVGGLVGINRGRVCRSCSTGNVDGGDGGRSIGGLVGSNEGIILTSYAAGDTTGFVTVGGLVGKSYGIVLSCYSTGDVNCNMHAGGLIGEVGALTGGGSTISNCLCTGRVNGFLEVGGLIGFNYEGGHVSDCFWNTEKQNVNVGAGLGRNWGSATHIVGLTTQMLQTERTFTDAGWDFFGESANGTSETWQMPAGGGYPVLSCFHTDIPVPLSGSGSAADPYLVSTAAELGMVCWYPMDRCFKLTSDIDLSGISWSSSPVPALVGRFDGDGHIIANMDIVAGACLGLIGHLGRGGLVTSIGLQGGEVKGDFWIGSVVGYSDRSVVSNCYSSVTVEGGTHVGGLVGYNDGSVSNCYSTGDTSGDKNIGGLAGCNETGHISNCFFTGEIIGSENAAGLVGHNSNGSVSNCYSTGNIKGNYKPGGLIGLNDYGGTISDCFWDIDTQSQRVSSHIGINSGIAINVNHLSTPQMQIEEPFTSAGWDFMGESANGTSETWQMPADGGYPVLSCFHTDIPVLLSGSGSAADPYLVSTAAELGMVCWYPMDRCFKLTGDIDLSGIHWTTSVVPVFTGSFDGDGHRLTVLEMSGGGYLGLFGFLARGGKLRNVALEAGSTSGYGDYVGGLVGASHGDISGCYNTGDVNGAEFVGGLVGMNGDGGVVSSCYSTGDISGNSHVGGLTGENGCIVSMCCSSSLVSGLLSVGGLAGINSDDGLISNCYATGNANALWTAGGLVGDSRGGSVANCYSIGVASANSNVGGLLGAGDSSGGHSFWDVEASGLIDSDGGVGKTTREMQSASTFLDAGWDFIDETENGTEDIWWIDDGRDYPRLWWE